APRSKSRASSPGLAPLAAAPRSRGASILGVARSFIVAPLARDASGRGFYQRSLARGRRSTSLGCASLEVARFLPRARSLGGCASLQGRLDPRRRSLAHRGTARSRRLGAPGLTSGPPAPPAAPPPPPPPPPPALPPPGSRPWRLRLAPGAPRSSASLARSSSHRSPAHGFLPTNRQATPSVSGRTVSTRRPPAAISAAKLSGGGNAAIDRCR